MFGAACCGWARRLCTRPTARFCLYWLGLCARGSGPPGSRGLRPGADAPQGAGIKRNGENGSDGVGFDPRHHLHFLIAYLAKLIRDKSFGDNVLRGTIDLDIEIDEVATTPQHACYSAQIFLLCRCEIGDGEADS